MSDDNENLDEEILEEEEETDIEEDNEEEQEPVIPRDNKAFQKLKETINEALLRGAKDFVETDIRLSNPNKAKKADKGSKGAAVWGMCMVCQNASKKSIKECNHYSCWLWTCRPYTKNRIRPEGYVPTTEQYEQLLNFRSRPVRTNFGNTESLKNYRDSHTTSVGRTAPMDEEIINEDIFQLIDNEIIVKNLGRRGRPLKLTIEEAKELLKSREQIEKMF